MLRRVGAAVDLARNGKEGVKCALAGFYDVVLMDVQMPEMDGLEATALLRSKGFDRPIIALTAHAFEEEGQRGLDAGYSDHLSKPIDYRRLVERIHFHGTAAAPAGKGPGGAPSRGKSG